MIPPTPSFVFAQISDVVAPGRSATIDGLGDPAFSGSLGSATITLIIAAAIGVLCVLWAVFVRKSDRSPGRGALVDGSGGGASGRRRRRRKDKRRSSNPTLAEVGGLPAIGSGDSSKPPL
jgi:hypothetical protein